MTPRPPASAHADPARAMIVRCDSGPERLRAGRGYLWRPRSSRGRHRALAGALVGVCSWLRIWLARPRTGRLRRGRWRTATFCATRRSRWCWLVSRRTRSASAAAMAAGPGVLVRGRCPAGWRDAPSTARRARLIWAGPPGQPRLRRPAGPQPGGHDPPWPRPPANGAPGAPPEPTAPESRRRSRRLISVPIAARGSPHRRIRGTALASERCCRNMA